MTRVRKMARRILLVLLSVGLGLPTVGLIYQAISCARDRASNPPPGKLVKVGDKSLHLYRLGEGGPAVILESGWGGTWLDWNAIQDRIAQFTTVCSYDRLGLGWSDPTDRPQTRDEVARRLHSLLSESAIPGPYVLVGHSLGGIYVRAFAGLYPDEVAGIVLIDSSHEQDSLRRRLPASQEEGIRKQKTDLQLGAVLEPFGVVRLFVPLDGDLAAMPLDVNQKRSLLATLYRTGAIRSLLYENQATESELARPQPPDRLGAIPLVVLTAAREGRGVRYSKEELPKQVRGWLDLQDDLARLSSRSEHIIAEHSGHYIHHDEPDLVVDAIHKMVNAARAALVTDGTDSPPRSVQ
jgi:pimeloyl-ACP methyl ester carboxylesterase